MLEKYPVAKRFGENIFNAVLEECKRFVNEKRISVKEEEKGKAVIAAMTYKVLWERMKLGKVEYVAEFYGVDVLKLIEYVRKIYGELYEKLIN
ncbi:MAG: hypothetical protein QMD14_04215 [Candidatus Aenigmarchaeota archaeon]|nr:hypothetical protein [Candidatus Aenigmarchaeota archaeon]